MIGVLVTGKDQFQLLQQHIGAIQHQHPSTIGFDLAAMPQQSQAQKHHVWFRLEVPEAANDDQQSGIDIVRRALRAPARQIAENAGEDGAYIVGKLLEGDDYNHGFNAATGEYEDLVKSGVIDPAKVVRTALQDAASVASLLITTEALVAELPKEDAPAPMPAMDY